MIAINYFKNKNNDGNLLELTKLLNNMNIPFKVYTSSKQKRFNVLQNLQEHQYNYWTNFLKITDDLIAGQQFNSCICLSEDERKIKFDTNFAISITKQINNVAYCSFMFDRVYPKFFLSGYSFIISDIATLFKLSLLFKSNFLSNIEPNYDDFKERFTSFGLNFEEYEPNFDNYMWFNWCRNQNVMVRYE